MKKMKLYGCGECGSEFSEREFIAESGVCRYCVYDTILEYMGEFDLDNIYQEYWE